MRIYDFRYDEGKRYRKDNICPTLTVRQNSQISMIPIIEYQGRTRYLTPLEKWRLMGFRDEDYFKIKGIQKESTIQKQIGNSVCENVFVSIIEELL